MSRMSRAPAETAAELPTATEAALLEMVLGLPGVGPRLLGTAALPSLGRLSPAALAERTQIALFDATRLAAAFELGRRTHAARARRGALLTDAARVARTFGPRLASLSSGITTVVHWVRSPTPMHDRQAERTAAEPSDAEKSWDQRILERIPSGVDASLIAENLRLTPTERVERMRKALEFIEEAKAAHGHRLPARR